MDSWTINTYCANAFEKHSSKGFKWVIHPYVSVWKIPTLATLENHYLVVWRRDIFVETNKTPVFLPATLMVSSHENVGSPRSIPNHSIDIGFLCPLLLLGISCKSTLMKLNGKANSCFSSFGFLQYRKTHTHTTSFRRNEATMFCFCAKNPTVGFHGFQS